MQKTFCKNASKNEIKNAANRCDSKENERSVHKCSLVEARGISVRFQGLPLCSARSRLFAHFPVARPLLKTFGFSTLKQFPELFFRALRFPSEQNKKPPLVVFVFWLWTTKKIFSAVLRMTSNSCSFSWNIYR